MKQIGLFDESNRLKKLSSLGDPLEKLNSVIDWRMFEGTLNKVFAKEQKGAGGRPPYSYLLMFKVLILQRLFNISDDQAEYQINDRVSASCVFWGCRWEIESRTRRRSGCSGTPW
ncbi:MAG: transposase [Christensenellales bacterium]|jgi:IS5 family transposase